MRAPLPVDEAERLRALRDLDVLDSTDEADFDDIVAMAARICGVPMSLVSLVDAERQWIKARVGTDVRETSRDVSFCAHAILGRDLLVVADAREDPRFADNPGVLADPGVRFYAGAPLVTTDGYAVGTLCVVDGVPHRLTLDQLKALRALSRQVSRQLELRRYAATASQMNGRQWQNDRVLEHLSRLVGTELRAPLRQIREYLERIAADERDEVDGRAIREAARAYTGPLRRLIDDLTNLAAERPLLMRTVDLGELVRRAVDAVRPVAYVDRVPVMYRGSGILPVHADPVRLDQALTHVLFNAVKYTSPGGRVEVATESEAGPTLRIVDPDPVDGERPGLFTHFYRSAIARPPTEPGPDQGLAVAKQILDVHHATVALYDQPGEGTSLYVVFPQPAV